ncbi:hypothetical protein LUZ60_004242 [Juncus effusus]|nr:hypothetical protein LUZ60_004242 [Juncus effusus]
MEGKWGNAWRPTINEKKFISEAIQNDLRVDGRRPFDFRRLTIKFGREDGSSEVQLGETHVMGHVTGQLVQPYRDRPNEGSLSIYTEFSPMADPAFEPGRPSEAAIELGRVVDRGLRESRAVDMESLCVIAGKSVWAIRVDLHIIDNGGNLIDAANMAALAALSTFKRPECSIGGENNQEIIIHDPQVRDPIPLTIHHLPIAVTFAFFSEGNLMVIDPNYKEEAVMGGRMTLTLNSNGEICSIQKAGGEGVISSIIMQCVRIASLKATEISTKIKSAVEAYNNEKALKKVKRHPAIVEKKISVPDLEMKEKDDTSFDDVSPNFASSSRSTDKKKNKNAPILAPLNWDPYSTNATSVIRNPQLPGPVGTNNNEQNEAQDMETDNENKLEKNSNAISEQTGVSIEIQQQNINTSPKSLKDAVKPKNRRKKKADRNAR